MNRVQHLAVIILFENKKKKFRDIDVESSVKLIIDKKFQSNMKIYDCFMFFDEEMLLDLRLNIMDQYIDKFVITEATYLHSGKKKKLVFDINKYPKFKNKIIYKKLAHTL